MNHQPNSETSARLAAVSVHRSTRRLILWDIDHTLIETRGLGGELYANAFEIATGTRMVHKADVTGQTEPSILIATLRLHGITEDEPHLSRYEAALPAAYDRHRDQLARRGRILPGARQERRIRFSSPSSYPNAASASASSGTWCPRYRSAIRIAYCRPASW
jgi:hypothetical protein